MLVVSIFYLLKGNYIMKSEYAELQSKLSQGCTGWAPPANCEHKGHWRCRTHVWVPTLFRKQLVVRGKPHKGPEATVAIIVKAPILEKP